MRSPGSAILCGAAANKQDPLALENTVNGVAIPAWLRVFLPESTGWQGEMKHPHLRRSKPKS
ncbi:uncharacterized protein RAG0_04063 [Rhynchosporium agropyri]|uniref:Uncharacterized protein n=2 Tax=Rhynchosporium TaxID=38037 RepID=A0A1E1MQZ6_RHYSE|nr:uncharacterized protein RAG0_04063 [Rhynchosporium agropyri]CZT51493.1 uncharacterized protein RSE6_12643 [Rhynchosporium secalis]